MTKVAALYIATGRYTVFWPEFYESAEKYLLKDSEVHYFVFTDAATLPGGDNPRVHICAQDAYSWPFATLRRFEIFLKQEQALKAFDYIFFFNANAEFMLPGTREMLLPRAEKGEHLLVVQHPSFYAKPNYEFTYDRNPRSTACIPYGLGTYYVCGGVNGGGQPIRPSFQNKPKDCADRDQCLRGYDARSAIRFSHENQAVQTLYDEYLEAPLSDRAHHLLHVEEY